MPHSRYLVVITATISLGLIILGFTAYYTLLRHTPEEIPHITELPFTNFSKLNEPILKPSG